MATTKEHEAEAAEWEASLNVVEVKWTGTAKIYDGSTTTRRAIIGGTLIVRVEDEEEASHLYDDDSDALLDMDFLLAGRALEGSSLTEPDVEGFEDWEFWNATVLTVKIQGGKHILPAE